MSPPSNGSILHQIAVASVVSSGISNITGTVTALAVNKYGYIFAACGDTVYRSIQTVTSVKESHIVVPSQFVLYQNFPNPFNPSTIISYLLPSNTIVSLGIYDVLGRKILTLVDGPQSKGMHSVTFDGAQLASGVYFYRLAAGNQVLTKEMVLLK